MRSVAEVPSTSISAVGKERKPEGKQITFRVPEGMYSRLEKAAEGIGLDISSTLRLLLKRHLYELEDEAKAIREKEGEDANDTN